MAGIFANNPPLSSKKPKKQNKIRGKKDGGGKERDGGAIYQA